MKGTEIHTSMMYGYIDGPGRNRAVHEQSYYHAKVLLDNATTFEQLEAAGFVRIKPSTGFGRKEQQAQYDAERARVDALVKAGHIELERPQYGQDWLKFTKTAHGPFRAVQVLELTARTSSYEGVMKTEQLDEPRIVVTTAANIVGHLPDLLAATKAHCDAEQQVKARRAQEKLDGEAELAEINKLLAGRGLEPRDAARYSGGKRVELSLADLRKLLR